MERDQALTGTIALLGLSGYEADASRIDRACAYFETRGLRTLVVPSIGERHQRFSASDQRRLAALRDVVADESVGIVMGTRGGYGLSRLLDRIDFQAIARGIVERGVRWVGQSDWTALQLALLRQTGAVTHAGPFAAADFGAGDLDPFTEADFWRAMHGAPLLLDWAGSGPSVDVCGTLWGGNLAMLTSLLGTPYMPHITDGILFLEDVNEHPYRLERMLVQLDLAGVLKRQQAIIMGDFSAYRLSEYDCDYDLDAALSYIRERVGVPIVTGLPFGHTRRKATLPVGATARLTMREGAARLSTAAGASGMRSNGATVASLLNA